MITGWITSFFASNAGGLLAKFWWVPVILVLAGWIWWQDARITEYQTQEAVHQELVAQQAENAARLQELIDARNSAEQRVRALQETLRQHDLAALAKARPTLIERRANDATSRLLEQLACTTSSAGCPDPE